MSSFKQSIFWVSFYLAVIFILAQFDYSDSPIIDFAKYFYFLVMVAVPATIFFPFTSKVSVFVPLVIWGMVYLVALQLLDRTASAPNSTFSIILLEFILIIVGVWLAYQLANGISHAESVMDAMALSAFPHRTQNIEEASRQIKVEITRSRRYHRPLSLIVFQADLADRVNFEKIISSVQHDLRNRFSFARIGQVIDEHARQTDMVFRDRSSRFVILCPETDYQSSQVLLARIIEAIQLRTDVHVLGGVASFPDDALNFDDLMDFAVSKLSVPRAVEEKKDILESHHKA